MRELNRSFPRDNKACAAPVRTVSTSSHAPCHPGGRGALVKTCKQSVTVVPLEQGGRFSLQPLFDHAALRAKAFQRTIHENIQNVWFNDELRPSKLGRPLEEAV